MTWWQHGVIYQIYPRSFMDTTGDGIGDLPGIVERLDHLVDLGVDAVWVSPFYRSPMADFGYDVEDYRDVDPIFGTLDDADALIAACHDRDLRVIVDYVPNHTSDRHRWFRASRSSRDDPKRDWYVWRDPKPDGTLPNNWLSHFGGPAWTLDERTGQCYLHLFLPEQPDLNWRNPEVREAMYDVMRFWLERGVDGFRIDVAHLPMKDPGLRDNPPAHPGYVSGLHRRMPFDSQVHVHDGGHPDIHEVFREMRSVVDEYPDRYTVGEIAEHDLGVWASYYGDGDGLHMPFNFAYVLLPWEAAAYREAVEAVEAVVPDHGWPNHVLGNHDVARIATRAGSEARARVAMAMLLTLRGTPTIYYGDEIGMPEVEVPSAARQDPWALREEGQGRDGCRTPMLWTSDAGTGFGFGSTEPWLPFGTAAGRTSVADQRDDPRSMLALTRRLLRLRRAEPALHAGTYRTMPGTPSGVFAYTRGGEFAVALSFVGASTTVELGSGIVEVSTGMDRIGEAVEGSVVLGPDEGLVVRLSG
ncbi:MAG: alpha-amylase family glycosyl hydrolase [Acidimicrobiia bacterium]|nr:alpha-amylase family glycosyl hydrolase [Acidimicrobiia bacterium]